MATKLLTRREAADFLGVKPNTLSAWARSGTHDLPYVKICRHARYRLSDLEEFVERCVVRSKEVGSDHRDP